MIVRTVDIRADHYDARITRRFKPAVIEKIRIMRD